MDEGERLAAAPRPNPGRGVGYWSDGSGDDRIIVVTPGYHMVALDAETGRPLDGEATLLSAAPPRRVEWSGGALDLDGWVRGTPRWRFVSDGYEPLETDLPAGREVLVQLRPLRRN